MTSAELPTAAHTEIAQALALALEVRPQAGLNSAQSAERLAK